MFKAETRIFISSINVKEYTKIHNEHSAVNPEPVDELTCLTNPNPPIATLMIPSSPRPTKTSGRRPILSTKKKEAVMETMAMTLRMVFPRKGSDSPASAAFKSADKVLLHSAIRAVETLQCRRADSTDSVAHRCSELTLFRSWLCIRSIY